MVLDNKEEEFLKKLVEVEEKNSLKWYEKRVFRTILKKARKQLNTLEKQAKSEVKYRRELELTLLRFCEVLEIRKNNDEFYDESYIKTLTNDEITKDIEDSIKFVESLL